MADRLSLVHTLARAGVAFIWLYQGLVPKYIFRDWSEMNLLGAMGVSIEQVPSVLLIFSYLEMAFALMIVVNWRSRWPLWATIGSLAGGLASVAQHSPRLLHAAFNPVALNGLLALLAVVALIAQPAPAKT